MMLFIELYTLNRAWNGLTDDELLWEPMPGPMGTGAQIIGAALNEVSHHGTQIGVLRDLYRLRAAT